jgi:undecaprenyl-diphosphatase
MINLLITFSASYLIWLMLVGLVIISVVDGKIKKEQALHALLAFVLAWAIAEIIKKIIPTARPYIVNGYAPLVRDMTYGSFPSAHSAAAFALATTIWFHDRKVGWLYIFLALVVGVARILANVHYPIDVLGGTLVGIITSFATEKAHLFSLLSSLRKRIKA